MTSPPERLVQALADRYGLERELGHGGMATVHLVQDLRHDREVAVKVLRPDLAAMALLELAVDDRAPYIPAMLNREFGFTDLPSDSRFAALRRRVGFE